MYKYFYLVVLIYNIIMLFVRNFIVVQVVILIEVVLGTDLLKTIAQPLRELFGFINALLSLQVPTCTSTYYHSRPLAQRRFDP